MDPSSISRQQQLYLLQIFNTYQKLSVCTFRLKNNQYCFHILSDVFAALGKQAVPGLIPK